MNSKLKKYSSDIIEYSNFKFHGGVKARGFKNLSNNIAIQNFIPLNQKNYLTKINLSELPADSFSSNDYPPIIDWQNTDNNTLVDRIENASIVGLGGAVFPTHLKLKYKKADLKNSSTDSKTKNSIIETLIVNAMECEPYITCDDLLLQEHSNEILVGALISSKITGAKTILFGIEDNKQKAIEYLEKAIIHYKKSPTSNLLIKIIIAPTLYPSGGEKQIIQLLTGKQVPQREFPASLGIIVQNTATLFAIQQAVILGRTLTDRLVTITGDLVKLSGNYWIPFGTAISEIVDSLKIEIEEEQNFILGGPFMGKSENNIQIKTNPSVNCIIFDSSYIIDKTSVKNTTETTSNHNPCIRCGECEAVCPTNLLPQQLLWYAQSEQWQQATEYFIYDCIECAACDYVCPSDIPLVEYFQYAKYQVQTLKEKLRQSEKSKSRFENREKRLARIKFEREEKRRQNEIARKQASENSNKDPDGKISAIEAALARVKNKKESRS